MNLPKHFVYDVLIAKADSSAEAFCCTPVNAKVDRLW